MTLQEIIAAHEARPRSIPSIRTTTLTPKGEAVALARRVGRMIAELEDPLDRLEVMGASIDEAARLLGVAEPRTA